MFFSFQAALTDAFSTIDSARLVPEAFKSIVPKEKFAFRLRSVLRLPILGAFSFLAHTFGSCCLCVCSFQLSSKMHSIVFIAHTLLFCSWIETGSILPTLISSQHCAYFFLGSLNFSSVLLWFAWRPFIRLPSQMATLMPSSVELEFHHSSVHSS